ncbi:ribbon-helix-helix protein, CopG family [Negativibacillus massiliensis]|uniref:ribbon-helix-helix protein, CopG family n=1 Tax=Negativibacillus massiliensis TaxID=1871035 RepID=UPI003AF5187B
MSNFILKSKKIKQEKVVISVRMDEAVLNTIEQALINTNISRNEFINQAIEYALDHMSDDTDTNQ